MDFTVDQGLFLQSFYLFIFHVFFISIYYTEVERLKLRLELGEIDNEKYKKIGRYFMALLFIVFATNTSYVIGSKGFNTGVIIMFYRLSALIIRIYDLWLYKYFLTKREIRELELAREQKRIEELLNRRDNSVWLFFQKRPILKKICAFILGLIVGYMFMIILESIAIQNGMTLPNYLLYHINKNGMLIMVGMSILMINIGSIIKIIIKKKN